MKTALLLAVTLCGLPACAAAQQPSVSFQIAKPQALTLANPFQLNIGAALPAENCSIAIDTTTQASDSFEILSIASATQQGGARNFAFTVVPFDIGVATFPALSWALACPNTPAAMVKSPELPFEIAPVSTPTAGGGDIIDIRPQYSPDFLFPWWVWLLIAAAAAALYYYMRRRKSLAESPQTKPDTRLPHERALDDLEALLISQLWEDGRYMEFFIRMAEILREYLERRFSLSADRLTTMELYRAMLNGPVDRLTAGTVRSLLNDCDMVKFAKQVPDKAMKESSVDRLRAIIAQTMPPPPPPNAGEQPK